MNKEELLKSTTEAIEQLAKSLETGSILLFKEFLDCLSRFPQYSYRNVLLIQRQFPEATEVKGFSAWLKEGRSVSKGQKGIAIVAPTPFRTTTENEEELATNPEVFSFRAVYVFDISQTQLIDESDVQPGVPEAFDACLAMERVYADLGIYIESAELPNRVLGSSFGGKVIINQHQTFRSRLQTLAHELAHELLHQKHGKLDTSIKRSIRELEAESISYVVCRHLGVDCLLDSVRYIASYKKGPDELRQSLVRIQQTALEIIRKLEESATATQDTACVA
ncbi:MAG: hypothetical protein KDB03_05045 [Planctomycetales bacterium]|nr:hypothetical protein [Planctomycetales bacterium]